MRDERHCSFSVSEEERGRGETQQRNGVGQQKLMGKGGEKNHSNVQPRVMLRSQMNIIPYKEIFFCKALHLITPKCSLDWM